MRGWTSWFFKNIDAQNTKFENESFDYVIASNMIHHAYPIKFFREMNRILKKMENW